MLLGLASCSSELDAPEAMGEGNVNFTVALPGTPGTRAFSDGLTAENLQVAVYDVTDPDNVKLAKFYEKDFGNALQTQVSLALANGREYKIAFFASLKSGSPYTFDTDAKKITVDYSKMTQYNSTDNYDCFYQLYETGKVTGAINETITLYRPVAQINWGTSDLKEDVLKVIYGATDDDAALANLYTKVTTKGYTEFDFFEKDVVEGTQTDVTYVLATRPAATENFPYQPKNDAGQTVKTYDYLSMQYLLVPQASSIVDLKLESAASAIATESIAVVDVPNAPVQANYRTNIFGALLTNPAEFNVVKEKNYNEPDYNNGIVVKTEDDFVAAFTGGKDKTIILDDDLDVSESKTLFCNSEKEVDLNGHKLTAYDVRVSEGQSLKIKNGDLESTKTGNSFILTFQENNGTIELDRVKFNTTAHHPIYFNRNGNGITHHNNKLIIKDCELTTTGAYMLSVGAGIGGEIINGNTIEIENSTLKAGETAIVNLQNVTVNAKNSNFYGTTHGVIFRSGDFNATNCHFYLDTDGELPVKNANKYPDAYDMAGGGWGSTNDATFGCIVVGSRGFNDYNKWPIAVKLADCTAHVEGSNAEKFAGLYINCTTQQQTTVTLENYKGLISGCGIRYNADYGTTPMQGGWIKINGKEYTGTGEIK